MALTQANTYIEPTSASAINSSRAQYNNSLRALLGNFKSAGAPTTVNIIAAGDNLGEVDGMLYRSATTNALYISDSIHVKSSPVGGNFTRIGVGNRVENGIVALAANIASYEIGELVATVSEAAGIKDNARLYLITSNAADMSSVLDVGAPQGYSVGTNDNVTFSGQSIRSIRTLATTNVAVGTNSPSHALHIVGTGIVTEDVTFNRKLTAADITVANIIIGSTTLTATATELNALDGVTLPGANLLVATSESEQRTALGLGNVATTTIIDEDDMSSDSAGRVPSQQSVKAYVDNNQLANVAISQAYGLVARTEIGQITMYGISTAMGSTVDGATINQAAGTTWESIGVSSHGQTYFSSEYIYYLTLYRRIA